MSDICGVTPVTVLVCALGGEGGGLLTKWLVEAAEAMRLPAQSTSIPGVAQRTGSTTYYVEIFPHRIDSATGSRPVLGLTPVPGAIDLLLSSELLETARHIATGMASKGRTTVLSSSGRTLTTHERMQMGDGRIDQNALLALVAEHSRAHQILDMGEIARQANTVVSAVMLGAVAGSGVLPIDRHVFEEVIKRSGRNADASLAGFARAYAEVAHHADLKQDERIHQDSPHGHLPEDCERLFAQLPPATQDMARLGAARVTDYQDRAYARLYLERLVRIAQCERECPGGTSSSAASAECARYLALWMAFDDVVRVAQLKARRARRERVARDVKHEAHELLHIEDYFKPGVPELAGLLPPGLAALVTRAARRRARAGKAPWSMPLRLDRTSVWGMLQLRLMASLKRWRRHASRFAFEQEMIERWLAAVEAGLKQHARLGEEIALCGRLIKGYGATNERGRDNLLHILDHLAFGETAGDALMRADAVRQARLAALADDAGVAFDRTLVAHGAPKRAVKEMPIRIIRRPRDTVGAT